MTKMNAVLLERAIEDREELLSSGETTACRLFDGDGDGCHDVFVDQLGDVRLVSTRERELPSLFLDGLPESCRAVYWKRLEQRDKQSPECVFGDSVNDPFTVGRMVYTTRSRCRPGIRRGCSWISGATAAA